MNSSGQFLGFQFRCLSLDTRPNIEPILLRHEMPLSGYTFPCLWAWEPVYHYRVTVANPNALLIAYELPHEPGWRLLQPVGEISSDEITVILDHARHLPSTLRIDGVTEQFLKKYPKFAAEFNVSEYRAGDNYVYQAKDLAELAGRKYAKKRNLIAQARALYSWECLPLDSAEVSKCFSICEEIGSEKLKSELETTVGEEVVAMKRALADFDKIGFKGAVINIDGHISGFSIFERLDHQTAVIHFEKAKREYKGLYQVINQEVARMITAQGFSFINREEDLGDPGLRQAKESYHPYAIVPSFSLTLKR